ncbi:unnamed protein product, partial [Staurois parvus]
MIRALMIGTQQSVPTTSAHLCPQCNHLCPAVQPPVPPSSATHLCHPAVLSRSATYLCQQCHPPVPTHQCHSPVSTSATHQCSR